MADDFVCDLCTEAIRPGEPHVRIGADAVVHDGQGRYGALSKNEVVVFAAFHSECLLDTMDNEDCDDVPYIYEARALLERSVLCEKCEHKIHPAQAPRLRLTVLEGGRGVA